jgi:hypothetical protein
MLSIKIAKERGATLRVGPELEIPYAQLPWKVITGTYARC